MMNRPLLFGIVAAVVLAACTRAGTSGVAVVDQAIPVCETIPIISAPEDAFRDTPVYVANEMPTEEIQEWARTKPGFEGLWIDRDHGGWVTVAFSAEIAARQVELADEFPGVGVVAVEVDWRAADLERLQQRVAAALTGEFDSFAVGLDVQRGMVDVGIGVLTDDRIEAVRSRFAGERVCLSGMDPTDAIPEAPQPTSGEGWRLLASENLGEAYRTGIATDDQAYRALWDAIGFAGEPPRVDFKDEVVVWFGAVYGSSCPDIRLDDVVSDLDRRLLHGTIVLPSTFFVCTEDANPRAFLVAVERSTLPPAPFAIQLGADDPPAGAPEERTIVDIDLREPRAVLGPGDAHPDPSLPEPWVVESGSVVEPGFEVPFRLDVRCGVEWLGRLNDVSWRTEEGSTMPPEWQTLIEDDAVVVSVLLRTEPEPTITATAKGHSVVYRPSLEELPACR